MNRFANLNSSWLRGLTAEDQQVSLSHKIRRFPLEFLDKIEVRNAKVIPKLALYLLKLQGSSPKAERSILRLILTRLLPVDPLFNEKQSPIDLYLLTHPKDVEILPTSLAAAQMSVRENLQGVFVIGPDEMRSNVTEIFRTLDSPASFISDEEILTKYLGDFWESMPTVPRMEVLKLLCGIHSKSGTALVLDGDTVLLRERTWSSDSRKILILAQEYLIRHLNFNEQILNEKPQSGLGFVAHHQVVIADEVKMLAEKTDGLLGIANKFQDSYVNYTPQNNIFPSEWQLIGDFRITLSPKETLIAKFSNYGISRDSIKWRLTSADTRELVEKRIAEMRDACPGLFSLSLHRYK